MVIRTTPVQTPFHIEYNDDNSRLYIVSFNNVNIIGTSDTNIVVIGNMPNPAPTQNGIEGIGIVYNQHNKQIYITHIWLSTGTLTVIQTSNNKGN